MKNLKNINIYEGGISSIPGKKNVVKRGTESDEAFCKRVIKGEGVYFIVYTRNERDTK